MSQPKSPATECHDGEPGQPATTPMKKTLRWWLSKLLAPVLFVAGGLLLIVAVGVAQRIGWIAATGGVSNTATSEEAGQKHICPMHPQIRQTGPGRCPICGMKLEPATDGDGADLDEFSLHIQPAQRRLANIETSAVRREPMMATIQTIGEIAIDESRMATIASYVDGRLERLYADYTGVDVAKGDHLAVAYSPELFAAQVEYIESRKAVETTSLSALEVVRRTQKKLLQTSRQKLVELGMQDSQIKKLETSGEPKSRLTIYTPIGGTVIEKLAVEGKYVKAGEPIYRVADLSTVWLMLELYPEDAAKIRFGQQVEAMLPSLPGEQLAGRVAFIDPKVERKNRTVGVRVEFLNEDRRLRPGDYANATIFVPIGQQGEVYDAELSGRWISPMHPQIIRDEPGKCPICGMELVPTSHYGYADAPVERPASLHVPRSALLMAGNHSVVYVEHEPGRFELRSVTIGPILRDQVVILDGLKEGEQVATAGNFLIDSQMQLAGKPSLIDPTRALPSEKQRNIPLEFDKVQIVTVTGETGEQLESLFGAYFRIQQTLAADKKPTAEDATALHQLASSLIAQSRLPRGATAQLEKVARHSEHLHHLELKKARHEAFRPLSHAIVELATLVRGESAVKSFHHMFCPMVKGGAGDWLQPTRELFNPYWGSEMSHCGDRVHEFPPRGSSQPNGNQELHEDHSREPAKEAEVER